MYYYDKETMRKYIKVRWHVCAHIEYVILIQLLYVYQNSFSIHAITL